MVNVNPLQRKWWAPAAVLLVAACGGEFEGTETPPYDLVPMEEEVVEDQWSVSDLADRLPMTVVFHNLASVVVPKELASLDLTVRRLNDSAMAHGGITEIVARTSSGEERILTDRDCGEGELRVDGAVVTGKTFLLETSLDVIRTEDLSIRAQQTR